MNDVVSEYLKKMDYQIITPGIGPYLYENMSFLESLILGKRPYPGLEIGLNAHKIIELAYQSSREDKIIRLS